MSSEDSILVPMQGDQVEIVCSLFAGIHQTAAQIFREGWEKGQAEAWVSEGMDPSGAFGTVFRDEYVVCYAAFDAAQLSVALIQLLDERLVDVIGRRGDRPLFCNVRGDMELVIALLRQRCLTEDSLGYELKCCALPDLVQQDSRLDVRSFEPDQFEAYLTLLDGAFNPLMQQTGHPMNPFSREREDLRQRLMDRSTKGDFAAFWRGQRLIGLYYLSGDVIDVLAVHPDFHHAGYGTVLIQHAARQVLQVRGYPAAYLFVVAANEGARRLYLRLGFEISGFYSENTYAGINC